MAFHAANLTGFDGSTFPNFLANMPAFSDKDAVYAILVQNNSGAAITPPAGWTLRSSDNNANAGWSNAVKFYELTGGAVAGVTASSYTWTSNNGVAMFIWIGSFSDRALTNAALIVQFTQSGAPLLSAPVTAVATGINARAGDDLCTFFYLEEETATDTFALSTPTGLTLQRTDLAINAGFWCAITASKDNVSAGATGTISSNLTQSSGTSRLAWGAYVFSVAIAPPVVALQPTDQFYLPGGSCTFSTLGTTGSGGTISYQWQSQSPQGGGFTNVAGATGATYSTLLLNYVNEATRYQCVITDSATGLTVTTSSARALMSGQMDVWLTAGQPAPGDILLVNPTFPNPIGFDMPWALGRTMFALQPWATDPALSTTPVVLQPGGIEAAIAPNRAQSGPSRHPGGEPLPAPAVSTTGKEFDVSLSVARPFLGQSPPGGDAPPPSVFTATGYEHADPSSRPQAGPPRHVSGEPVPPRVFPGTGFERMEQSARARPSPGRAAQGEPQPPPELLPPVDVSAAQARSQSRLSASVADAPAGPRAAAGFDPAHPLQRAQRAMPPSDGEARAPSVLPPTGFEHAEPGARVLPGPPRHSSGEPVPPQVVAGAGIETTPPASRALAKAVVDSGGVVLSIPGAGGFDSAPPAPRAAGRSVSVAGEAPTPRVFTATGFETATAPGRAQPGPPRHLAAEPTKPAPPPILAHAAEASPPVWRSTRAPDVFGGHQHPPRVFAPTGFEAAPASGRPQAGPPRHASGEVGIVQPVRGAGIENAQAVRREAPRPIDQSRYAAPAPLGPAVESVVLRGRVFTPAQSFGGEAFTTPVWTASLDTALTQRRQDAPRQTGGEGAKSQLSIVSGFDYQEPQRPRVPPPTHQAGEPVTAAPGGVVSDSEWARGRGLTSQVASTSEAMFTRPLVNVVFASAEAASWRPTRKPLWIDSNGLPAVRIQPPTLQIPREFEVTRSVPVQTPTQFLVALPTLLQVPRKLLIALPAALALPSDFEVVFSIALTIPPAFEVALPPVLGIPSRFEASTDL